MASSKSALNGESVCISDKNSLNLIRLLAAFQVLFGHAEGHFQISFLPSVFSKAFSVLQGVPIFFILSGFLIWNSIAKTYDFGTFCKKRVFRLYPELWCGVALNFLLIIILYFKNIQWLPFMLFQLTQATFLQFWTPNFLRGYGIGTPNGSLWTICVMLQAYLVMWFLHKLLHRKGKAVWFTVNVISVALSFTTHFVKLFLPEILVKLYGQTFVPYLFLFVFGMTLCEFFGQIISFLKRFWYVFALASLAVVFIDFDFVGTYGVLKCLFIAPAIIGFSYRYPRLSVKNDYSYGIYIYHMIVINLMIHFGLKGSFWNVLVVIVLSVLLAMISYHTIGAYSRRKRKSIS